MLPAGLLRKDPPRLPECSELDVVRHFTGLSKLNYSVDANFYPLGSCTMKYNPKFTEYVAALPGFSRLHPLLAQLSRGAACTQGALQCLYEAERWLCELTGMKAFTFQPMAGANGEFTGVKLIAAYHKAKGRNRKKMLIPDAAHGTNPASAALAGFETVNIESRDGMVDPDALAAAIAEHGEDVAGLMMTCPNTLGLMELYLPRIVEELRKVDALLYYDGANMNAQVGLTNPGYIGADVCHLNLHKTFAMPHGGGGPGVGPICVAEHLRKFLPSHSIVPTGGDEGITAVASAPWGSAMLFPITYGYIKMLGGEGLKAATEMAIVNANYMSSALKSEYRTYYSGETGRVGHEMILDLTHFKKDYNIDCGDIAHRLMDYGFHAPTLSFPVHETLMVEPTESEPKAEMDRFIATLIQIKRECEEAAASGEADNVVVNAPHTAAEICGEWSHPYTREKAVFPLDFIRESKFFPYVSKIDNGYGDRNLVCRCTE